MYAKNEYYTVHSECTTTIRSNARTYTYVGYTSFTYPSSKGVNFYIFLVPCQSEIAGVTNSTTKVRSRLRAGRARRGRLHVCARIRCYCLLLYSRGDKRVKETAIVHWLQRISSSWKYMHALRSGSILFSYRVGSFAVR
jgi:hypothetical protein